MSIHSLALYRILFDLLVLARVGRKLHYHGSSRLTAVAQEPMATRHGPQARRLVWVVKIQPVKTSGAASQLIG